MYSIFIQLLLLFNVIGINLISCSIKEKSYVRSVPFHPDLSWEYINKNIIEDNSYEDDADYFNFESKSTEEESQQNSLEQYETSTIDLYYSLSKYKSTSDNLDFTITSEPNIEEITKSSNEISEYSLEYNKTDDTKKIYNDSNLSTTFSENFFNIFVYPSKYKIEGTTSEPENENEIKMIERELRVDIFNRPTSYSDYDEYFQNITDFQDYELFNRTDKEIISYVMASAANKISSVGLFIFVLGLLFVMFLKRF